MKLLKNIVVILVALIIFVFFFAGKGVFDDILPVNEVKSVVLIAVGNEVVVDNGKYGYMVKSDQEDAFLEVMEEKGYVLANQEGNLWTFQNGEETLVLKQEDFLGCLLFKENTSQVADQEET